MEEKTKTTNADRCKRYREKNAAYKINDALRKKRARSTLKLNKNAYEEHKKGKENENVWLNTKEIQQTNNLKSRWS